MLFLWPKYRSQESPKQVQLASRQLTPLKGHPSRRGYCTSSLLHLAASFFFWQFVWLWSAGKGATFIFKLCSLVQSCQSKQSLYLSQEPLSKSLYFPYWSFKSTFSQEDLVLEVSRTCCNTNQIANQGRAQTRDTWREALTIERKFKDILMS